MFRCPHCEAQLSETDLRTGKCRHCDFDLASHQTIDDSDLSGRPDATLDFTGDSTHNFDTQVPPSEADAVDPAQTYDPAPTEGGSIEDAGPMETLDSVGSIPSDAVDAGPDATFDATVPPGDSAGMSDQVQATWAPSVGDSRPNMTIKTLGDAGTDSQSSLVIQSRELSQPGTKETLGSADYDLIDLLGEGGMGVVYTARQASIDRTVAVKMLKPDTEANDVQKQKFLSEAVVTGELDHPNIVPIYDLGRNADGALFYSMKKIQGTPWLDKIKQKSLIENLQILLKVADAVAFAHSRGVVHRDLKPENVMLGEFGEVLVLDWGLAITLPDCEKAANMPKHAGMGGTPAYMAPEMAIGPVDLIGRHSDIYLLGAILFECVTGKRPHLGKTAMRCILAASRNEIAPTERTGELVDVAMKAMATAPEDRYSTVQDFQDAVRNYLEHSESISLSSRAAQELDDAKESDDYNDYARSLYVFEEAYALWNENRQAKDGISKAQLAYADCALRKGDYDLGLSIANDGDSAHRDVIEKLKRAQSERDARQQRLKNAKRAVAGLLALVFVAITGGMILVNHWRGIAVENELAAVASAQLAEKNAIRADRNAETARENAGKARASAIEAQQNADRADERRKEAVYEAYLASIGLAASKINENALGQARAALENCDVELRNWEWRRLRHQCQQGRALQIGSSLKLLGLATNADLTRVVIAGDDRQVRVVDLSTGKEVLPPMMLRDGQTARSVAISPVNDSIVVIGTSGGIENLKIWNLDDSSVRDLEGQAAAVNDVAFSSDGQRILAASEDAKARIWNLEDGELVHTLVGHSGNVLSAEFSADDQRIVTASQDKTVRIWNANTGKQRRIGEQPTPFRGHTEAVTTASFSPDGKYVASAGFGKEVLIWRPDQVLPFDYQGLVQGSNVEATSSFPLAGHTATVSQVQFSPDGKRLLSAGQDNSIKVWTINYGVDGIRDASLLKTLRGHDSVVTRASFVADDSDQIVSSSYDGCVRSWSVANYEENRVIPDTVLSGFHDDAVLRAEFSPSGDEIVTASRDRTAKTWATAGGPPIGDFREGHLYLTLNVEFYPEGHGRLLTSAVDGTVRVWDLNSGAQLFEIGGTGYSAAATLSDDGEWILTASARQNTESTDSDNDDEWQAKLWNASDGSHVRSFGPHKTQVTTVAFSPDKRWVFTGDANGNGNLWNADNGHRVATLPRHTRRVSAAVFHPDSQRITTGSEDRTVFHWSLADVDVDAGTTIRLEPSGSLESSHPQAVTSMAVSRDGDRLLTGCADGQARLWSLNDGQQIWATTENQGGNVSSVAISPDATQALVVDSANNIVSLFDLETGQEMGDDHYLRLQTKRAFGAAAAFSSDGTLIATVGGDEACVWDTKGNEVTRLGPHHAVSFASYSFPDAKYIVTAGRDNSAKVWDTQSQRSILKLIAKPTTSNDSRVNSAVFSPIDASRVLTTHDDAVVRIWKCDWESESGNVILELAGHEDEVVHAVYSSDGRLVASSSLDKTIRIWNADSGELLQTLIGHTAPVRQAAFSPDGSMLATASDDFTIRIWQVETGEMIGKLEGHTAAVSSVAFSPDNSRVLSGSADRTVKLWDALQFREVLTLAGHRHEVTSVAFSNSGGETKYALSASRDGTAIIWLATPITQDNEQVASQE